MKTIKVKVTDAQAKYIQSLAIELGSPPLGDLLLALSFLALSYNDELSDSVVETAVCSLKEFVTNRRIPRIDVGDLLSCQVLSRPAVKRKAPSAAVQELITKRLVN